MSSTPRDDGKENAAARLIAPDGVVPYPEPPPPHNPPDAPTDCCMSGCLHCVWNHYLDDVIAYQRTVRDWHAQRYDWARDQLMRTTERTPQAAWWQRERDDAEIKMREPESEEAERRAALSVMDPAMRVFWEMEQKANRDE
ncbi:hypothetical protein AMAG_13846 [Allomyces macrogynus ATCC 38327]|uniref:Oxidoreductase-like domain-containing protein n=1 Tax=Allomyces macrogynus (strain ATCC 38327) TaxID=578462 RepID=A0A0L0T2V5_ALLM3|nr:hypothetical protein AMAG_13846 [Allomyces macrogynus ATCC 38327]|eukprot:KNE68970.1 hypothetical protein AMAG_13846 [Allomyces macrogynus ATCC 38327]